MKNTKFRAFDKATNKMIFTGFHLMGEVMTFSCIDMYLLENKCGKRTSLERWNDIIITEYTGFKIKDIDLYEHDIISFKKHKGYRLDSFIAKVIWIESDGAWGYEINGFKYVFNSADEIQSDILDHCVILGNEFEKPKLLKKIGLCN